MMGLEPRLQLDPVELQQIFYRRSRELHPDRFARATKDEQAAALEESSLLNDAYRTLKDASARAEYFLKENGLDIATQGSKNVPAELLEEVFELNLALEELKSGDGTSRADVGKARGNFTAMLEQANAEAEKLFAAYDAAPSEKPLEALRQVLNRRRYIANLLRDIDGHLRD